MSRIRNSVKANVLKRDDYRCQECGIRVGERRGLEPHFHHKLPQSAGGKATEDNLITLCGPCHFTKLRHTFRIPQVPVEDYPQYVKWMLREMSIELLAFAERLVESEFPSATYLSDYLGKVKNTLDSVANLVDDCRKAGIGNGVLSFDWGAEEAASGIEEIIKGLKIAWVSHYTQRSLDQLIQQSTPQ
jgi:hypothetical protein